MTILFVLTCVINTVRDETHSELILRDRKIEFESCKLKTRSDSELSEEKWRNTSSDGDLFDAFWANSSGGFEGPQTFFQKKNFNLYLSIFSSIVPFIFSLLFSFILSSFSFLFTHRNGKNQTSDSIKKNGHAPRPIESRESYQSVNPYQRNKPGKRLFQLRTAAQHHPWNQERVVTLSILAVSTW